MNDNGRVEFINKGNGGKAKFRKTKNGFEVIGGNHKADDLAAFCNKRRKAREAAETRLGSKAASRIKARLLARLERA